MIFEFMAKFFSKNPTLSFIFAKRPPTFAAKWITKVGLALRNKELTEARSQRSPSYSLVE